MILEYRVNEADVQAAWLKTLYDLIEELNCKCRTTIEETYNKTFKHLVRTRVIQIYGSSTILDWFKIRMERYLHFVDCYNQRPEIIATMKIEE